MIPAPAVSYQRGLCQYFEGKKLAPETIPEDTGSLASFVRQLRSHRFNASNEERYGLLFRAVLDRALVNVHTQHAPKLMGTLLSILVCDVDDNKLLAFLERCPVVEYPIHLKFRTGVLSVQVERIVRKFPKIHAVTGSLSDIMSCQHLLGGLSELSFLDRDGTCKVTCQGVNDIFGAFPQLVSLSLPLAGLQLQAADVESIEWPRTLQRLKMSGYAFTNRALERLFLTCPELHTLEIPGCVEVTELKTVSPKIEVLNIDGSSVDLHALVAFARQSHHLRRLSMRMIDRVKSIEIEQHWNDGFQLHLLAKNLLRSDDTSEFLRAERVLRRVVALMPAYHGARFDLAYFLATSVTDRPASLERLQEACRLYEGIVASFPDDLEAKRNLAMLYLDEPQVKNHERAYALLRNIAKRTRALYLSMDSYLQGRLLTLERMLSSSS